MPQHSFPHIRVKGTPYERGKQYGQQAKDLIRRNLAVYAAYFNFIAGWEWAQAVDYALAFEAVIETYSPYYVEEQRGIAAGSGVAYEDILALNVRTEIRNTAIAHMTPGECTAFVVLPPRSKQGHTLVGQNWDWITAVAETMVVMEVESDHCLNFVTVVEAGLLAKAGMDAA